MENIVYLSAMLFYNIQKQFLQSWKLFRQFEKVSVAHSQKHVTLK